MMAMMTMIKMMTMTMNDLRDGTRWRIEPQDGSYCIRVGRAIV